MDTNKVLCTVPIIIDGKTWRYMKEIKPFNTQVLFKANVVVVLVIDEDEVDFTIEEAPKYHHKGNLLSVVLVPVVSEKQTTAKSQLGVLKQLLEKDETWDAWHDNPQ